MRKSLSLGLSILMTLSLGLAFVCCSDDNGETDPCPTLDCCDGKACPTGETCTAAGVCESDPCPDLDCCDGKECATGEECNASGECVCEGAVECCDTIPCEAGTCVDGICVICCDDQENFGFIAGPIMVFPPDGTMAQVAYAVVSAMDALTNPDPTHIEEGDTDANGLYETACFDMGPHSLALMILSDDAGYDGAAGNFFPTYSGVMEISTNDDRTCVPDAPPSWAVPVALVTALSQVPPLATIADDGFAIVFVTDPTQTPVAGAVLMKHGDPPTDLPVAIYPNADFTAFDGTETSANGIVIIPGPMGLTNVVAEKDGMAWTEGPIGAVAGFCFTRPLVADE